MFLPAFNDDVTNSDFCFSFVSGKCFPGDSDDQRRTKRTFCEYFSV